MIKRFIMDSSRDIFQEIIVDYVSYKNSKNI